MFEKMFDIGREAVGGIFAAYERVKKNKISKRTLERMLLVECRHNIAVLDVALMSDEVSELEGLWSVVHLLSNEVCRAITFSEEEHVDKAYFNPSESDKVDEGCGSNVMSIYARIETLKALVVMKEKGIQLSRVDWKRRMKNIRNACLEIIKSKKSRELIK